MTRNTVAVAALVTTASLMTSVVVAVGALSMSDDGRGGSPEPILAEGAPAPTAVAPLTPSPTDTTPAPIPPPPPAAPETTAPPTESDPTTPPATPGTTPPGPTETPRPTETSHSPGLPWTGPWFPIPTEPTGPVDPSDPDPDALGSPEYAALWLWCWLQPWEPPECRWMRE